jgi:hypothetical protein
MVARWILGRLCSTETSTAQSDASLEAFMTSDADDVLGGEPTSPRRASFLHQVQGGSQFLGVRLERPAIGDRINLSARGQFVDRRLHHKRRLGVTDGMPPPYRDVDLGVIRPDVEVRNRVVSVGEINPTTLASRLRVLKITPPKSR